MRNKRSRADIELNLIPLIDCIFFILTFLMLTSVFRENNLALSLSLPTSKEGAKSIGTESERFLIEVSDNALAMNGKPLELNALDSELNKIVKKESAIELRVGKEVKYQRIVDVLDLIKKHQLSNLSLMTKEN